MTLPGWLLEVDVRRWLERFLGQGLTLTAVSKESEVGARDGPWPGGDRRLGARARFVLGRPAPRRCVQPACWPRFPVDVSLTARQQRCFSVTRLS